MSDRRKQQNYQAACHYLTAAVWNSLENEGKEKSLTVLFHHLFLLGLRCPTETTFAMIYGLLVLSRPGRGPESSFERYKAIGAIKQDWKRFKTVSRQQDLAYCEYLETLPENASDLPAEYQLAAFEHGEAVPCSA